MNQGFNHDPPQNQPHPVGLADGQDLLSRSLPSLPWSVESKAFDLFRGERIIADITRKGTQITSIGFYGINAVGERRDEFKIEINDLALSERLNDLSGSEKSFASIVKMLEKANADDPSLCRIEPARTEGAIREEARVSALQNGRHISSVQQARSLSEIQEGIRRTIVVMAKELYSGDVLTLSIESAMNLRSVLEVSATLKRRDEDIFKFGRKATAEHAQDLTDAVVSLRQTFELSNPFNFIEQCKTSRGMLLPADFSACEPRFAYGRNLRQRIVEVDSACVLSSKDLVAAHEAYFDLVTFAVLGSEFPCRLITLMVNESNCRGVTLTFENGSQLLIRSSLGDLIRGNEVTLDGFIEQTLENLSRNPFIGVSGRSITYTVREADTGRLEVTDKASVAINSIAYQLWLQHRQVEGLFPADFHLPFFKVDLGKATDKIPLLRQEQFSLLISLDSSGIREVEIFERRSQIGRFIFSSEHVLKGTYSLQPQERMDEVDRLFSRLVQLTRDLSSSRKGWKGNGALIDFLQHH